MSLSQTKQWLGRIPTPSPMTSAVWTWCKIIGGLIAILMSVASFLSDMFAPSFYATYELQERPTPPDLAVKTLSTSVQKSRNGIGVNGLKQWLEAPASLTIEVVNASGANQVRDILIAVHGSFPSVYFATDWQGQSLDTSPKLPSDNVSQLEVRLGSAWNLSVKSAETIVLYGDFGPYGPLGIDVSSSNRGAAKVMPRELVFGWRGFVAENAPWLAGIALLLMGILVLRSAKIKVLSSPQ